ncbi:hypothetical protein [Streptomyces sp. CC208A]|uniref:hypothetical protein n=1 Tax=Streptomyces sp. CC208A TaxID=3044573 RepID=UPI0024A852E7|nr:hypothetical protein [Streptomyces sp. CC208A]
MYGQMPAAPAPRPGGGPSAGTVAVRVLLTATVVLSLGLLAWVAMLRLAIMRRTLLDWVLFWAQLAATVGCFVLLQEEDENSWQVNLGAGLILAMAAGVIGRYLAVDVKHHRTTPPPVPYPPHAPAYGYPPVNPSVNPATAVTTPSPYTQQPPPPNPYATTPTAPAAPVNTPTPAPTPGNAPTPPPAPRIDQVRAELDELSDLLRREREGDR